MKRSCNGGVGGGRWVGVVLPVSCSNFGGVGVAGWSPGEVLSCSNCNTGWGRGGGVSDKTSPVWEAYASCLAWLSFTWLFHRFGRVAVGGRLGPHGRWGSVQSSTGVEPTTFSLGGNSANHANRTGNKDQVRNSGSRGSGHNCGWRKQHLGVFLLIMV